MGDALFLVHMLERARRIERHTRVGRAEFMASEPLQDLAIRGFEIIGEAAGNLSETLRAAHPELPWRRIIGFRNVLIQQYWGIDLELVWQNIVGPLPELIAGLETIPRELDVDPNDLGPP